MTTPYGLGQWEEAKAALEAKEEEAPPTGKPKRPPMPLPPGEVWEVPPAEPKPTPPKAKPTFKEIPTMDIPEESTPREEGLLPVDPTYAEQHPEAVVKVGDDYYRPSIPTAEWRKARDRGLTTEQIYAEAIEAGVSPVAGRIREQYGIEYVYTGKTWTPIGKIGEVTDAEREAAVRRYSLDTQQAEQRFEELGKQEETLRQQREAMVGGFGEGWAERLEQLSPEDKEKYQTLANEETYLSSQRSTLSSFTQAQKKPWAEEWEMPEDFKAAVQEIVAGTGLPVTFTAEGAFYDLEKIHSDTKLTEKFKETVPNGEGILQDYVAGRYARAEAIVTGVRAEAVAEKLETDLAKFEANLEVSNPNLHKIYKAEGIEGYNKYIKENYTPIFGNEYISNDAASSIREQSEYGYNILVEQGIDAYNKVVSDALAEMEEYKRPSGYRLKPAVSAGVSKETLSLLFPKEDVDNAWLVKFIGDTAPEVEAKPTSGLPLGLVAILPVAGVVAVAEPTFIGEAIVVTAIGGAAAYAILRGRDLNWDALWNEVTDAFRKEADREPTPAEVTEMETIAANTIRAEGIAVTNMPQAIAMKATEPLPTLLPGVKALTFPPLPSYKVTEPLPSLLVGTTPLEIPPLPGVAREEPYPSILQPPLIPGTTRVELDNIMVAQAQVAEAEKEIETIIKPKVLTPSEIDALWGLPKTEAGLVALDAAVQDAFTAGEIDDNTLRVYNQARIDYLTKRGTLDSATQTAVTNMGLPEPTTIEQENMARKIALSYSAAAEAQRIAQGFKSLRAEVALEAPRIFAETVTTNVEVFESDLQVYYEALGESQASYLAKLEALNQAINKYIAEYSPQLQSLTALAVSTAINTLQQQATQAATQALNQALAQDLTQAQAQQAAQTAAQNAIQQATQTAVKTAVQSATQTLAITDATTISVAQTAVLTAVNTATLTMTKTAVNTATATGILPPPPPPRLRKPRIDKKKRVEPATICWRQGIFWITMPPPYNKRYYSKKPPAGVYKFAVGEDSPYKTIQCLGGCPKKDILGIDIGIAIVDIRRKGEKELTIHFKQDVEDTYKGKTIEEKVTTIRASSKIPEYTKEPDGRIRLTEKPKVKRSKPRYTPFFSKDTAIPQKVGKKPIEKEGVGVTYDRYYLGHKLPDSNVRVEL